MGKTYKDSKNFNPSDKPKNKKSQKDVRKEYKFNKLKEDGESNT